MKDKGKKRERLPRLIIDSIAERTGYSRRYVRAVIKGQRRNVVIEYLWKLSQEDMGKFLEQTKK